MSVRDQSRCPEPPSGHALKKTAMILLAVNLVDSAALTASNQAAAQTQTESGKVSGCTILGFKKSYQELMPTFRPGSNVREPALANIIEFPVVPLSFDPLTNRFLVAVEDETESPATVVYLELLKAHLVTIGNSCNEKLVRSDPQRCKVADQSDIAGALGSNDGSCPDKPED